jgi:hypothetical protein
MTLCTKKNGRGCSGASTVKQAASGDKREEIWLTLPGPGFRTGLVYQNKQRDL